MKAREKSGHSCPAHKTERKGENGPQLPGVRQDWAWVFMIQSERNNVYYMREQLIGKRGKQKQ